MDEPVTDVAFVSSKENCPEGYRLIDKCPCGREAQMWEKVLGGESGERYLCFTKQDKDDMVVEDMYIPGRSAQYLYKGYKIVKKTVEGDEPMYHKQLAVKRVPRTHASKVIADIIICRSRDNVSKMYKKLDKVNGLCICFRQVDVGGRNSPSPKPTRRATHSASPPPSSSSSSSAAPLPQRGGSLKISDVSQYMAGLELSSNGPLGRRATGPAIRRTVSPLTSHVQRSPSPSLPPQAEGGTSTAQSTVFPPSSPPPQSSQHESTDILSIPPTSGNPPSAPSSTTYPPPNTYYPPPPSAPTHPPSYHHPPNIPPSTHHSSPQPHPTTYPPHGGSYQGAATNTMYPPPMAPGVGYSSALGFGGLAGGVQPPPPSSGYPSYPPQRPPPGGYGGYGAVAGPSFTAAPSASHNPSGPAPYNPYQSQQGPPSYPPPPTTSQASYGFKF